MEINEILVKLDSAIDELLEKQHGILKRNLNELNLNGYLRGYLVPLFPDYDVDPEYNGDRLKENDRKALQIAKDRMREIGIPPNETNNYKLTPDIIIHKQNTNDDNLVVIEVKKDSNTKKNIEFDLLKLEHLTIAYKRNHYNYKLGVAIVLGTRDRVGAFDVKYFQNGIQTSRSDLK